MSTQRRSPTGGLRKQALTTFMTRQPLLAAELNELVAGLKKLSRNIWWCWDQEAQDLFQELSPRGWTESFSQCRRRFAARCRITNCACACRTRIFINGRRRCWPISAPISRTRTPGAISTRRSCTKIPSRIFPPSSAFTNRCRFRRAASAFSPATMRSPRAISAWASSASVCFTAKVIFSRRLTPTTGRRNFTIRLTRRTSRSSRCWTPVASAVVCSVEIGMSRVFFQAWRVNVGRVPVYLLDTNRPENEQHFRDLTLRVYGGDSTTRIMQEILLGIGGTRLLRTLGVQPSTFHMNEGHAAFLTLELIREKMAAGKIYSEALAATKAECHFTTHTPVEAGHDRFTPALMDYAMQSYRALLTVPWPDIMGLGRVNPADVNEPFCMTVLALKVSRAANGVSELHGEVSRQMWQSLYPEHASRKSSHRSHHQRHPSARLDEGHGAAVLAEETDGDGDDNTSTICHEKFGARLGVGRQFRRILGEDDRPGIRFRRGTLGVALQAAPRAGRVRPPPVCCCRRSASRRAISSASTIF